MNKELTDKMMECVDMLAALEVPDPRAWEHLLVYAPRKNTLSDEQIDELLDTAHRKAVAEGITNGGMVGQLWNHIAARAIEARVLAARPVVAMSDERADMQFIGDVMILQVLADSGQVNEQEREVLQRWIAASQPPSREMALAQRTSDLHHKAGMPLEQAKELARSEMIEDTSACTAPAKECATGCVRARGVALDRWICTECGEVPADKLLFMAIHDGAKGGCGMRVVRDAGVAPSIKCAVDGAAYLCQSCKPEGRCNG